MVGDPHGGEPPLVGLHGHNSSLVKATSPPTSAAEKAPRDDGSSQSSATDARRATAMPSPYVLI
jgi:hypothetical protein